MNARDSPLGMARNSCWHQWCCVQSLGRNLPLMRIRIVQRPTVRSIDGIRLDRYEVGRSYDVGNSVASLLLAEQWAEPVPLDELVDAPELIIERLQLQTRRRHSNEDPTNLIRERQSPYLDTRQVAAAADRQRRSRRRR